MEYEAIKEVPSTLNGLENFETIPKHAVCEVKIFCCVPSIFYKGKAVCNVGSRMCEDYFREIVE